MIVLMLENRSFDHALGFLKSPGYDIDGLSGQESNDDDTGEPVRVAPKAVYGGDYDVDPGHDFEDVKLQLYGTEAPASGMAPNMAGFVKSYGQRCGGDIDASRRVMRCFAPESLPVLTTLAKQYAVCDRWFSSLPGPTLPNRLFAHAGTCGGRLDNSPEYFGGFRTIYEVLDTANVSATIYAAGWTALITVRYLLTHHQGQFFATLQEFEKGCKRGKLSSYCFLEPRYGTSVENGLVYPQNDQHPDSDVAEGENLIWRVYQAIRKNENIWNHCLFVITYDEHGGFYDHVPPPAAEPPDDKGSQVPPFDFRRYGVRVPAVLVSPYISAGTISHTLYDHTSLLSTAAELFLNRPLRDDELGARAAKAATLSGVFDQQLLDHPREDVVVFPKAHKPSTAPPPDEINTLQREHLRQAAYLEERLPPNLRTGIYPSTIQTSVEAEEYVWRVLATVRVHGLG